MSVSHVIVAFTPFYTNRKQVRVWFVHQIMNCSENLLFFFPVQTMMTVSVLLIREGA